MTDEILKTPDEWATEEGITILDPDGWRGIDAPPFDRPITKAEYTLRVGVSTVIGAGRVVFPDPPVSDYAIGSDCWPGLAKLVEECGELQQVLGKLVATHGVAEHWDGTNLVERLGEELGDVLGAIAFLIQTNDLNFDKIAKRASIKIALFEKWQAEQATP